MIERVNLNEENENNNDDTLPMKKEKFIELFKDQIKEKHLKELDNDLPENDQTIYFYGLMF